MHSIIDFFLNLNYLKIGALINSILILCLLFSGCATKSLIEESQRKENTQQLNIDAVDRITHAYQDNNSIYLCLERTVRKTPSKAKSIENYLIDIPLPSNKKWLLSIYPEKKIPFFEATNDNISTDKCDKSANSLPILDVSLQHNIVIPDHIKNAVYVMYEDNNLRGIGYISSTPLSLKNQSMIRSYLDKTPYSFPITLDNTNLYSQKGNTKPHLLLLTPITAAIDIIGTAIVVFGVLALISLEFCGEFFCR